jgi:hypothetical protein
MAISHYTKYKNALGNLHIYCEVSRLGDLINKTDGLYNITLYSSINDVRGTRVNGDVSVLILHNHSENVEWCFKANGYNVVYSLHELILMSKTNG